MKRMAFPFPLFLLLLLFFAPAMGWADDERTIAVTVVKNDTLIKLCGKYLSDRAKWPEIGRINRLRDVDLIHPGQSLIIPVRLLRGVPVDGRVIFVKGDAAVQAAGEETWRPLRLNDRVRQGNLIKTGRESTVEIAFDDGTSFLQRPDTTLRLNETQRKGETHIFQRLLLPAGRLLMNVKRATGQESRIEIHTPSATAVARGTDFRVSVDTKEAMTSEVLEGSVAVEAMKREVTVQGGEGTRVTKGAPPLPPRKLLPPPAPVDLQPLYRRMPFPIAFTSVKGASHYRVLLSLDREGKDVIREQVIAVGEPFELAGLDDGVYHLRCRSIDEIGLEGASRAPETVRVRINPQPPFIQEPADGDRYKGTSVSFRWLKVKDAARYRIQISPDREFRTPGDVADLTEVGTNRVLAAFGTYHFRVRSQAADGHEGLWSDVSTFTLVPPPAAPEMEKPQADDKELRIRWRNQGEKMSYRCQVSREEGFGNILLERKVDRPEIVIPRPGEPGIYYVRTSTIDPTGYEGGFSSPQSFEIKPVEVKPPAEEKQDWTAATVLGVVVILFILL
ncbi:MAG: FecR family protein [Syntrophales bacterium]